MQSQENKNLFNFKKYCKLYRWSDYWHQINEILKLSPENVLEIGVGEGVVGHYLKNNLGLKYTSVDLDRNLKPDVVGNVDNLLLENNSFDIVCAFEVLEHLSFGKFKQALKELGRVSKRYVIISLPQWGRYISIDIRFPCKIFGFKRIRWLHKFSFFPPRHQVSGHYWEMGKKGYGVKKIKQEIRETGFKIINDFIVFESPYHHFFILKKEF